MAENETQSVTEEIVNVKEVKNNVRDSVDDTRHNLNDEHRRIAEKDVDLLTRDLKGEQGSKKKLKMKVPYEKYRVERLKNCD